MVNITEKNVLLAVVEHPITKAPMILIASPVRSADGAIVGRRVVQADHPAIALAAMAPILHQLAMENAQIHSREHAIVSPNAA